MPDRREPELVDEPGADDVAQSTPIAKAAAALSDAVARLTGGTSGAGQPHLDDSSSGPTEGTDPPAHEADSAGGASQNKSVLSALGGVVSGLSAGAKVGGRGAVVGGTFLAEILATTATRLPLRDKATLLDHHQGLDTEQIADSLEQTAARVCAAVGAAAGGLAAAQWFAMPSLIAVPVELAAETMLVAAVELKLVAELHEIYDARPPGELGDRANAYLRSWTTQRGLNGDGQTVGMAARLASAGTAALRKRITGRLARNLGSFLPFLAGAVVGARYNASSTRKLSSRLRADLATHPLVIQSRRVGRD